MTTFIYMSESWRPWQIIVMIISYYFIECQHDKQNTNIRFIFCPLDGAEDDNNCSIAFGFSVVL